MRQVGRYLEELFEPLGVHLVAHQRNQDGQREGNQDGVNADYQGVADGVGKHVGGKVLLKIPQPCPLTAQDAARRLKILERDDDAIHGQIGEADKDDHGGNHQQV